jgi:hypothetical protein
MSAIIAKVSKEDLLFFARLIYKQALDGYFDLEDSVCIGETSRFFETLEKYTPTYTTSDITFSSSIGFPPSSQTFVSSDPQFSYSSYSGHPIYTGGEISPTEQQLLFFDSLDSSDNASSTDSAEIEVHPTQQTDSNEGHVFHNF